MTGMVKDKYMRISRGLREGLGISALCERTAVVLQAPFHWPGSDEVQGKNQYDSHSVMYLGYYSKYYYFANMQCDYQDPNLPTASRQAYLTTSHGI